MEKDPLVESLQTFLNENKAELKIVANCNGEVSQGATAFLNELMARHGLGVQLTITLKKKEKKTNGTK